MPDPDPSSDIIIFIILLLLSAFFSAAETALFTVGRHRSVNPDANYLDVLTADMKKDSHRLLTTILIGNTVVNVANACFITTVIIRMCPTWPWPWALLAAIVFVAVFVLIFGELLPKAVAISHDVPISHIVILPLYWLSIILMPVIWLLKFLPNAGSGLPQGGNITEEELINIVEAVEEEGGIDEDEKEFIYNIFKFNDTTALEIMTPRGDMFVVNLADPPELAVILGSGFSRIPVIENDIDNIVGILHIKDLFQHALDNPKAITYDSIMREPYLVPANKKINDLFAEFNQRKQHLAIVVDEYGGVSGLITQEDILEEIVGEIMDETDEVEKNITELLSGHKWIIAGKTEIEDVVEAVGLEIPEEHEFETFSGYVLDSIGRIPAEGEVLEIDKYIIIVEKVEGNRVSEYTLELAPLPENDASLPE